MVIDIMHVVKMTFSEWNSRYISPASQGINIGFSYNSGSRIDKLNALKIWTVKRKELEQVARHRSRK